MNEMIYIGDTVRDFEFASNAGIDFYGVMTGIDSKEEFLKSGISPTRIIPTVHTLTQLF